MVLARSLWDSLVATKRSRTIQLEIGYTKFEIQKLMTIMMVRSLATLYLATLYYATGTTDLRHMFRRWGLCMSSFEFTRSSRYGNRGSILSDTILSVAITRQARPIQNTCLGDWGCVLRFLVFIPGRQRCSDVITTKQSSY